MRLPWAPSALQFLMGSSGSWRLFLQPVSGVKGPSCRGQRPLDLPSEPRPKDGQRPGGASGEPCRPALCRRGRERGQPHSFPVRRPGSGASSEPPGLTAQLAKRPPGSDPSASLRAAEKAGQSRLGPALSPHLPPLAPARPSLLQPGSFRLCLWRPSSCASSFGSAPRQQRR